MLRIPGTNGARDFESGWPRDLWSQLHGDGRAQGNGTRPFYNRDPGVTSSSGGTATWTSELIPSGSPQVQRIPAADQSHADRGSSAPFMVPLADLLSPAGRSHSFRRTIFKTSSTLGQPFCLDFPPVSGGLSGFPDAVQCARLDVGSLHIRDQWQVSRKTHPILRHALGVSRCHGV